jgi:hypothetical protein
MRKGYHPDTTSKGLTWFDTEYRTDEQLRATYETVIMKILVILSTRPFRNPLHPTMGFYDRLMAIPYSSGQKRDAIKSEMENAIASVLAGKVELQIDLKTDATNRERVLLVITLDRTVSMTLEYQNKRRFYKVIISSNIESANESQIADTTPSVY